MKHGVKLWFSILIVVLAACQPSKKITIDNFQEKAIPPNGVKISDNLFCDKTEVSNINWLEYLAWNKKTFGSLSDEYISALPDTTVWVKADPCLYPYVGYLKHTAYQDFPLVGITQQQANDYSKWRSDRVFEGLLITYKIIQLDTARTKENHFTIEKYFNRELSNIISDKKIKYYPEFRLPNLNERQLILLYTDSVDQAYFQKCDSKYCEVCKELFPEMWSRVEPCLNDSITIDPTRNVYKGCAAKKGNPIYNVRGNVSEWTSETNIAVGGSWRNTRKQILKSDTFNITGPNAWTGFRNVCEWKQRKE